MFPQRKPSFENNFYSKPVLDKNTDFRQQKNKRFSVLQEMCRTRLSEKDFYDKVKDWIETSNEVLFLF